ncbi:MAG: hypothetical protein HOP08_12795 [Cyclobacteriaceae bacterium]|nr:hypothetical protein [Cyclobacteriaceae bacterium]
MSKTKLYNTISLIFGIIFLLTSYLWQWKLNLMVSYPAGIIGIIFLILGRNADPLRRLNRGSLIVHLIGVLWVITLVVVLTYKNLRS